MGSADECWSGLTGAVFCDAGKGAGGHVLDQGEVGRKTLIARRPSVHCYRAPPSGRGQARSVPSARQRKGGGGGSGAGSNVLVIIVVDVWVRHCGSRRSRGRGLEIQVEGRIGRIILLSWLAVDGWGRYIEGRRRGGGLDFDGDAKEAVVRGHYVAGPALSSSVESRRGANVVDDTEQQ